MQAQELPTLSADEAYFDDVDRQGFLKTQAEACQESDWQIHAYRLMRNYFHLVVETPYTNLRKLLFLQWYDKLPA
jgi:hypothetical protein